MNRKAKLTLMALALGVAGAGSGLGNPPVAAAYGESTSSTWPVDVYVAVQQASAGQPGFLTDWSAAVASCDAGPMMTILTLDKLLIRTSGYSSRYYYADAYVRYYHAENGAWVYKGNSGSTGTVWVTAVYDGPLGVHFPRNLVNSLSSGAWYAEIVVRVFHAGTQLGTKVLTLNSQGDYRGTFRDANGYCKF